MYITKDNLIRAIRLMLAILIAFAITNYFVIPEAQWVYISIFVVGFEQLTIGGILKRSFMRAVATISSVIYSLIIIWLFNNNDIINLIAILFGLLVYLLLYIGTDKSYIGILGSVTLAIVLINNNNLSLGFMRSFDILIGCGIVLLVFYLFYPKRATTEIIGRLQNIILELDQLTRKIVCTNTTEQIPLTELVTIENNILKWLNICNGLISDAKLETLTTPSFTLTCSDLLLHLRRVLRFYSSAMYVIIKQQNGLSADVKQTLDFLTKVFAILHDNLVINFASFDANVVVTKLRELGSTITNSKGEENFLLTMTGFIIDESEEVANKFVLIRDTFPKVKMSQS